MKLNILIFFALMHTGLYSGGFATSQQAATYEQTVNTLRTQGTARTSSLGSGTSCNCPPTAQTTSGPMLNYITTLYDSANTPINSNLFATNQNSFSISAAIFNVDIFPPSNIISPTAPTPINAASDAYAIMYTLKSLDGSLLQKELQYAPGPIAKTTTPGALSITPAQIPVSLALATIPANSTNASSIVPILQTNSPFSFLPPLTSLTASVQQRIFNATSPLCLSFYITFDGTTTAATPLSGTMNSSDGATLTSCFVPGGTPNAIPSTTGNPMPELKFTLTDGSGSNSTTVTFNQTTTAFYNTDLNNGLYFRVFAYPPSIQGNGNFIVIITLQTLDGLKFYKKVVQTLSFSPAPTLITITDSANNTLFAGSTVNSAIQGNPMFNIQSPMIASGIIQSTSIGAYNVIAQ